MASIRRALALLVGCSDDERFASDAAIAAIGQIQAGSSIVEQWSARGMDSYVREGSEPL